MQLTETLNIPQEIKTSQRHRLYQDNIAYVNQANACYSNRKYLTTDVLIRHDREKELLYQKRQKFSCHLNYFKFFIDQYFKALFGSIKEVERKFKNPYSSILEYQSNIDLKGTDATLFFRNLGVQSLVSKTSYCMIDYSDELERAYAYPICFEDVIDWQLDLFGNYEWVLIKQEKYLTYTPDKLHEKQDCYLLYGTQGFQWYDDKGNKLQKSNAIPITNGINYLGFVPLIPMRLRDVNMDDMGDSFNEALLEANNSILNVFSQYLEEIYQNTFNILLLPQLPAQYEVDADGNPRMKVTEISTSQFIEMQPKTNDYQPFEPKYIQPNTSTLDAKLNVIRFLVEEMERIAGFKGKDSSKVGNLSGVSKHFDYINTNETLRQIAMQMTDFENKFWFYMYQIQNTANLNLDYTQFSSNINVIYPDRYEDLNTDKEIDKLEGYLNHIYLSKVTSKTAIVEAEKKYAKEILNVDDRTYKTIEDELDKSLNEMTTEKKELMPKTIDNSMNTKEEIEDENEDEIEEDNQTQIEPVIKTTKK
jgi:hypothetical protein